MTTPLLELGLHPSVWRCVESCAVKDTETRLARGVNQALGDLGVSQAPRLRVRPGPGGRALRVLVDDVEQPFPPSFLSRLWFGVAPRDRRELAFDSALAGVDGGQAWLVSAAELAEREGDDARRTVCELVELAAAEVVSLHPDALLGDEEAMAYFDVDGGAVPGDDAPAILRSLLELGASISDRPRVAQLATGAIALGRDRIGACEEALAGLRGPAIEIHVDEETFDALLDDDAEDGYVFLGDPRLIATLADAMTVVHDLQLRSLGVEFPVMFVRALDAPRWEMHIKINDRLSPPVPLPAPGEVGVSVPPATLERHGIRSRGLVDPVAGAHLSAVPEDAAEAVEDAGYVPVLPASYLAGAFGRTVAALGYRLITMDRVEAMLARFEMDFPVLVHGTLARYSLAELTRLLRSLVRERVPVDDLWRILNTLVIFAEVEWHGPAGEDRLTAALARVRLELADRIAVHSCRLPAIGAGVAPVFEVDPALEKRLEQWHDMAPPDQERRAVREAVWHAITQAGKQIEPVIVTSSRSRAALRKVLEDELPDVHVLACDEIPDAVTVERIGHVADVPSGAA